ncbi:MAG: alpha/beta fold hydrolase [Erythrobacter sp.]|nr:alpha/beta fold hydrolase [Erythrobacter sp.]
MRGGGSDDSKAPPLIRWLAEPLAIPKIAVAPFRRPEPSEPNGNGRPALVLPGMASGDGSTALLRNSLSEAGFHTYPASLGRNLTISPAKLASLETMLDRMVQADRKKAVLVGWSLGGFYARVLAQRHPSKVKIVATLGTPFSGDRRANNVWRIYELIADHGVESPPLPDDPAVKPEAYTIAFWSPVDGIVAPASARGKETERDEAVEFPFRHFELGCSKRAVRKIVETLGDRLSAIDSA